MTNRRAGRSGCSRKSLLLALVTALALPLAIMVGCGGDPISPTTSYFDLPYQQPGTTESGISASKNMLRVYEGEEKVSAEEGGTVSINMPGNSKFVVQPNSITENTTITANVDFFNFFGKNIGLFDFSPDGLQFSTPATLQIDAKAFTSNSSSVVLYWLNPDNNRWEFHGEYFSDDNDWITIPIHHFSKYGVSD